MLNNYTWTIGSEQQGKIEISDPDQNLGFTYIFSSGMQEYILFIFCLFVILVIYHFVFEDRILVLIEPVPGPCLPFTLNLI